MSAGGRPRFNPFPGLRPFDEGEAHLFFGRDGQSDELVRRLRRLRFLAVVGTSGSGKSSLVRAGLLPALNGGLMAGAGSRWRIAVFRPGAEPVRTLAKSLAAPRVLGKEGTDETIGAALLEAALRRGALGLIEVMRQARLQAGENLLVVADQFEELFRFGAALNSEAREENASFVKLLMASIRESEVPIYIVLTLRSEFLGECAQFRDLPEALNDGQFLVPRMTRDQRREAIIGPIAVGGGSITERLVQRLLNDVGEDPDQLPVLQHALMRTWDRWESTGDAKIDVDHYEAIGGLGAALSRHADEALGEASPVQRRVLDKILSALTEKGPHGNGLRRPLPLGKIAAIADARVEDATAVVERLRQPGRSFITPPAPTPLDEHSVLDISHEALIRLWGYLGGLVEAEAESRQMFLRLVDAAEQRCRGKGSLWRNPELHFARAWMRDRTPNAAWGALYAPATSFQLIRRFLKLSRRWQVVRMVAALAVGGTVGMWLALQIYAQTQSLRERALEAEEGQRSAEQQSDQQRQELKQQQRVLEKIAPVALQAGGFKDPGADVQLRVVEQSVEAVRAAEGLVDSNERGRRDLIEIQYFSKQLSDEVNLEIVLSSLQRAGFGLKTAPAEVRNIATNSIWFGDDVRLEDVKLVAFTLIGAGVKLRAIRPFQFPAKRPRLIQIGAAVDAETMPPLTVEQIRSTTVFNR